MCKVLGVSRSGYYKFRSRGENGRRSNLRRTVMIRAIYSENKGRYGVLKITAELKRRGLSCNKKTVSRIMRQEGLKAVVRKKYKVTTNSRHNREVSLNLLKQDFRAEGLNQIWLSDLTFIRTLEGWLYLVVVLDLYSRMIISYAADKHMSAALVSEALSQAIYKRGKPEGLIFHSDQGVQYASDELRSLLRDFNITQSMSRRGNCYDNAPMESFFHILKSELVNKARYRTRAEAKEDIFNYIEYYYNRSRIHSSLNYKTPFEYEKIFT
jgi:putative transposase